MGKRLAICRNMEKFKNKYRIPSARLQNWDYGRNAVYFITICTENREHYFGEIIGRDAIHRVSLTTPGEIAHSIWLEIPDHFPFIKLDVNVVMPNHVHGIIIIDKTNDDKINNDVTGNMVVDASVGSTVETRLIASLPPVPQSVPPPTPQSILPPTQHSAQQSVPPANENKRGGFAGYKNPMINENISRIIRWYKGRCSFEIRKIHAGFNWQSRFNDHIIRDSIELERIRTYIINNPKNWTEDRFFQ